ncbi:SacI homology domain-containing protein [Microdochium trichocladiopsis]|uniref:SacI homology domain-containing protein n=1 Tax=Microdochium trichocladiopsis TaxID=1682393 RepID=A0A9P8Y182_9PEZI|nr:SacI homology domain-containing protein [Microdochium trichocladiopsis]KAH7026191.1 SacI homology domain-containing protein [Microdochium trichocladiopsis]
MPALTRKLLIFAAVDGLVIQPLTGKGQRATKIKYGDATVSSGGRDLIPDTTRPNSSFEAFGVIGLFTVSRLSYLITITGREEIANVRGFPIYVVTDVALTPCTSQNEASDAIRHTASQLRRAAADKASTGADSDTDSEVDAASARGRDDVSDDPGVFSDTEDAGKSDDRHIRTSSVAEDVFQRKGSYGRFAQKWFSNKGWMMGQQRNPGVTRTEQVRNEDSTDAKRTATQPDTVDDKVLGKAVVSEDVEKPPAPTAGESLMPKLLRMAHIWFGTSRSFYFSYDLDITHSLASAHTPGTPPGPLHKTADPTVFWNRHLLQPFASNDDHLMLPVMQGFVGQRTFVVDKQPPQQDSQEESLELNDYATPTTETPQDLATPGRRASEKEFLITVISRRAVKRAGLRYLRRGIDDEGYTANSVETEQILSTPAWDKTSRIHSFVQIRGSIPLFFTQSPYSLKPTPVLQHSPEVNFKAFTTHFDRLGKAYGSLVLVNLVEKHGVESIVGSKYEENAEQYNKEKGGSLHFEWFDFHSACRGMKFENVSLLIDKLGAKIEEMGSTSEENGVVSSKQKGVLRTNCMDCLDRTNVCQSSFAKYMLDLQLKEEGFDMSSQTDQVNSWFNTLWADNGDAISKQYASTAAMKGDYTRTRKRDYRGMVNDLGLSLTRFYNGMVNDYFSQAAIDFLLGYASSLVFDEFEANMMTKDPGVSMTKMREHAIETSQKIAIENPHQEDFIGGWTVLTPHEPDTIKTLPFEEVVILLTDVALYLCRFDWKLDKVSSFERVDLDHVLNVKVGTYITNTISPTQADEDKNFGLVVTYQPGSRDVVRTNTRSLSNVQQQPGTGNENASSSAVDQAAEGTSTSTSASGILNQGILSALAGGSKQQDKPPPRKLALKALYAQTSLNDNATGSGGKILSEKETVDLIANELQRQVFLSQPMYKQSRGTETTSTTDSDQAAAGHATERVSDADRPSIIERGDIISLAEAKRSTGILEQWGHSIKKLVWAS